MLLAEDRIDVLVDRLRRLRSCDRRAILRRLRVEERAEVTAMLRGDPPIGRHLLPYSRDIMARISVADTDTDTDTTMTAAGRAALATVVARHHPGTTLPAPATASLSDVVVRWLRRDA